MKNYDDLQRFKDKTRTSAIDFKDMSAQSQQHSSGNWAIIKQLSSDEREHSSLAQGGSVAVPIPHAVDAQTFEASKVSPVHPETSQRPAATSILSSLAPQQAIAPQAPLSPPIFSQVPPPASAAAPVSSPWSSSGGAPVNAPAQQPNQPVHFDQLFATKGATPTGKNAKEIPLQLLLENIASCR